MKAERCPKCNSEMQEGFVIDRSHGNSATLPVWASGAPERHWFRGLKLRGRARFRVLTRRCRRCGLLESFALDQAH
jgi:hypothetical protein